MVPTPADKSPNVVGRRSHFCKGGLTDGIRKPPTMRVAGWRPDEGREGEPDLLLLDVRQESEITVFVHHDIVRKVAEILCFLF